MADIKSKEERSKNMSAIRNKNTKPELLVRKYLFSQGFRYRINVGKLAGKPDIVLAKYKTVIFINGCFWHLHTGCKYFKFPQQNANFWRAKLNSNVERDKRNYNILIAEGWKVIIIWECQLKQKREETLKELVKEIQGEGIKQNGIDRLTADIRE